MHWAEQVNKLKFDHGKVELTLFFGSLHGTTSQPSTPNSWAADPTHDVGVYLITLSPSSTYTLPSCNEGTVRTLYYVQGGAVLTIAGTSVPPKRLARVTGEGEIEFKYTAANGDPSLVLVLQVSNLFRISTTVRSLILFFTTG